MFAHADVNAGIPVAAGLPGPEAVSCRCFAASSASARFPLGASANEGRYTALAPPAPSRQATAFAAEPLVTASRATDFAEAKWRTTCHAMAQLGPTAEALRMGIEAAATTGEFVTEARRAHAVVRDIQGPARADGFGDLVESLLAQLPARVG